MPSITAPGIGSGLDVQSIVSQLMAIERQPLQRLQFKQTQLETQISAYGQLSSTLSTFQTAMKDLGSMDALKVFTTSSANPANSWLAAPNKGQSVRAPLPSAPVAKAKPAAVSTAKLVAVQRFEKYGIRKSFASSLITYRCILTAVSSVVPANDAIKTPISVMPTVSGKPSELVIFAAPITTALSFAPIPAAPSQLL